MNRCAGGLVFEFENHLIYRYHRKIVEFDLLSNLITGRISIKHFFARI